MVVLGIELDTAAQIARLPADKFLAIQDVLTDWSTPQMLYKKRTSITDWSVASCMFGSVAGSHFSPQND